jgi:transposase-like protein
MDEMFVRIGGKQMYLWRAVDAEGEVLDVLLQAKRDRRAAQKLMRKLVKRQGMVPTSGSRTRTRPMAPLFAS